MKYKTSRKHIFSKKHLIEIGSLLALLVLASAFKLSSEYLSREFKEGQFATLALVLEDQSRIFEGEVYEKMTVMDALSTAMAAGDVKLNYYLDEKNRTHVLGINGHTEDSSGKTFVFYLNSKKINSNDLNKIDIEPGDDIVIKFEDKI